MLGVLRSQEPNRVGTFVGAVEEVERAIIVFCGRQGELEGEADELATVPVVCSPRAGQVSHSSQVSLTALAGFQDPSPAHDQSSLRQHSGLKKKKLFISWDQFKSTIG